MSISIRKIVAATFQRLNQVAQVYIPPPDRPYRSLKESSIEVVQDTVKMFFSAFVAPLRILIYPFIKH